MVGFESSLKEKAETDLYIECLLEVVAMSHFLSLVFSLTDLLVASSYKVPIHLLCPFSLLHSFLTSCWTSLAVWAELSVRMWWAKPTFTDTFWTYFQNQFKFPSTIHHKGVCKDLCGSENLKGQIHLGQALMPMLHLGQPNLRGLIMHWQSHMLNDLITPEV